MQTIIQRWINDKDLLCSTGNSIQIQGQTIMEKTMKKNVCVYIVEPHTANTHNTLNHYTSVKEILKMHCQ